MYTQDFRGHLAAVCLISLSTILGSVAESPSLLKPALAASPSTPAISSDGIRADVLLAMLEQHSCWRGMWPASDYNGPALKLGAYGKNHYAMPNNIGRVLMSRRLYLFDRPDETQGKDWPVSTSTDDFSLARHGFVSSYWLDPSYWLPLIGSPASEDSGRCSKPRYYFSSLKPGVYTVRFHSRVNYRPPVSPSLYGEPWLTRGFNALDATITLVVREDRLIIGPHAVAVTNEDLDYKRPNADAPAVKGKSEALEFKTDTMLQARRDQRINFGTLVEWQHGTSKMKLLLIRGKTPDTAKLCLNVEAPLIRRLQCEVWPVPDGWQWGQELEPANLRLGPGSWGQERYLIDDRSVYPGESGNLYWRASH